MGDKSSDDMNEIPRSAQIEWMDLGIRIVQNRVLE